MRNIYLLIVLLSCLQGCYLLQGLTRKEFLYNVNNQREMIKVEVPRGFREEKIFLMQDGGKEQRYVYADGSILYFAHGKSFASVNSRNISDAISRRQFNTIDDKIVYRGKDSTNRYWKEIQLDQFRFGYYRVPSRHLSSFEQAVNGLYVK